MLSKRYLIASKHYKHRLSKVYMFGVFFVQRATALSAHNRVDATARLLPLGRLLIDISP